MMRELLLGSTLSELLSNTGSSEPCTGVCVWGGLSELLSNTGSSEPCTGVCVCGGGVTCVCVCGGYSDVCVGGVQ